MDLERGPVPADAITGALAAVRQPADAVCDRWTLEIVLRLLAGETRFSDLARDTGIAARLVASRLAALQRLGAVDRRPYSQAPLRHLYVLTPMGLELRPVLGQMIRWERSWSTPAPAASAALAGWRPDEPPTASRCAFCSAPVSARAVTLRIEPALLRPPRPKQTARRRTSAPPPLSGAAGPGHPLAQSLAIFGDKWGLEILICAFFGVRRFNDIRDATGISANILSDRLGRLTAASILSTARAGSDSQGYWLTDKGRDLYPVTVAMQTWADQWLPDRIRSPVRLIHRPCGREIVLQA